MHAAHRLFVLALPLATALGGIVLAAAPAPAADALRCEILASANNGTLTIEGVVHAAAGASGSYKFEVISKGAGGSSNTRQGGAFSASDHPTTLGRVMLGGSGGNHDVTLLVSSGGGNTECAGRFSNAG